MMSLFKSRMTSSTATTTTTTTMEQERSIAETLASLGASSQQTVDDSDSTEEQRKKEGKFPFPSEQQLTKPESSPSLSDSNDKKPSSKNTTTDSTGSTPTSLISTNVWRDDDILAGRSREVRCHVGNARFRDLIDEYQPAYKKAGRKLEKSRIAVKVFKIVQSRGGRFLDCKPDDPNSWFEISYDKAVAKVSQTLRKGAKHMKTTITTAANQPCTKNHKSNQGDDPEGQGSKSSAERKRGSSLNPNEDLRKSKKSKLDHGSISSRRDSLSSEGASFSATSDQQSSSTPQEEKPLNKKKNNASLKKKEGSSSGSAVTGESTIAHGLANALRAAGATDSSLQHLLLPGWASNGIAAKNSSAIPTFLQNPPHSSFAVSNAQYSMPTVQHPLAGGNPNMDLQALLSATHHQQHQHAATLPPSLSLQEIQALAHIQQSLNLGHQLSSSGTLPATTLQTLTGASSSIGGISLPMLQELQQLHQGHQHHSSGKPILLAVPQSQITGITNAGGSDSQQPLALVVGTLGTCCQCGAKAVPQRLPTNYQDDGNLVSPNKQGAKDSHQPSSSSAESPFSAPSKLPPQKHSEI